jgi:O-antigen ligase/polysaccharide polymerase Wzy-like membrane protein
LTAISASLAVPRARRGPPSLATGLFVLIWLLPVHALLMAWLVGGVGVPGPVVRLVAAWKESLVAALAAVVLLRVVVGRGDRSPVQWLDVVIVSLGAIALVYLVSAGIWFGLDVPVGARLYGLRDLVYFSLLYFVGRATPEIVRDERLLKALFFVGVVTSGVAVIERLLVTPQMLVLLGTAEYFQDFLGAQVFTAGNAYGLPINYWSMIGGHLVQRAGSTYLSSQGFAISFLIILPASTVWLLTKRRHLIAWLGYALLWIGLLLSITRMTIVVCLLQALVIAAARRRWGLLTTAGVAGALAVGAALLAVPGLAGFVWDTLTWQSPSSLSHLDDWIEGLQNALYHPFGAGLGVADQAAVRFGLNPLAGDNQYLTYAVELGILGLGLHLATMVGAVLTGIRSGRDGEAVRSGYGIVVATAAFGILLNGATAVVFNSMILACAFFWLLGSLTTPTTVKDRA